MSEGKIGINDKIGIYLTSDEIEHIRIALDRDWETNF